MRTAADRLDPLFSRLLGQEPQVEIRLWDGSRVGPVDAPARVILRSPNVLRRVLYAPNEIGFARAYVTGEADIEGDMHAAIRLLTTQPHELSLDLKTILRVASQAIALGAVGRPLPPPAVEARVHGRRHSTDRDAEAISHHYDVSNEFYALFLGSTMTYSCARFADPSTTLDEAQTAKYDLICRKLDLQPGMRLLDVGCGWGGMVMHAAAEYGVDAVGITISRQQFDLARKRVAEAGLAGQVEIRMQDYRNIRGEQFEAISSIGMAEHVGRAKLAGYCQTLAALLKPRGRFLNHAISTPNGASYDRNSFISRYVFPDGELPDVAEIIVAMQKQGLDVRDVEGLREHYAMTLRRWWDNLDRNWDEAVRLVGLQRARVWRLYLAGAANSFSVAEIGIHQVLGVKLEPDGTSGMPLTRASFV
jgi:cyclopropane-fatty-acyl-phospholipid synthase